MKSSQIFDKFIQKCERPKIKSYKEDPVVLDLQYPLARIKDDDYHRPLSFIANKYHFSMSIKNFPYGLKRHLFYTEKFYDYDKLPIFVRKSKSHSSSKITIVDEGKTNIQYHSKHRYHISVRLCPSKSRTDLAIMVHTTSLKKGFAIVLYRLNKLIETNTKTWSDYLDSIGHGDNFVAKLEYKQGLLEKNIALHKTIEEHLAKRLNYTNDLLHEQ